MYAHNYPICGSCAGWVRSFLSLFRLRGVLHWLLLFCANGLLLLSFIVGSVTCLVGARAALAFAIADTDDPMKAAVHAAKRAPKLTAPVTRRPNYSGTEGARPANVMCFTSASTEQLMQCQQCEEGVTHFTRVHLHVRVQEAIGRAAGVDAMHLTQAQAHLPQHQVAAAMLPSKQKLPRHRPAHASHMIGTGIEANLESRCGGAMVAAMC